MGMTMTQKILAAHSGRAKVEAGELVLANLDMVVGNDVTSPVAIKEFEKMGATQVFDRDKVTMIMDHFVPNKDIKAAQQCKICRRSSPFLPNPMRKNKHGKKVMKLDKTFKTLVVLGSDCFRPYYNTIVHSSDNAGFFHAAFFLLIFASVGRMFTLVVAKVTCRTRLSPSARML